MVYLTDPSTTVPIFPINVQRRPRRAVHPDTAAAAATIPGSAHHRQGRPRPGQPSTTRPEHAAAVEAGLRAREGPELIGVRREASRQEGILLLLRLVVVVLLVLLLLERGGGEVAEVLELLRLAEELHREEGVGRRHRRHGVGGAEAGERGGVHLLLLVHGEGVGRGLAGVAGPRVVGLGGDVAGRVEGAHGDGEGEAEAGGERFWVGF